MLDLQSIKAQDLKGLSLTELGVMVPQLLSYIDEQSNHIGEQRKRIDSAQQAIKWRDAKIEKIMFELARLKAWKFGAKSERMTAEQRELFAEALAADQASLEEQLAALQATANQPPASSEPAPKRKPKREPLPQHLPRVDHRVEPENTMCECGQAMERVGEDVSERLDIVPAKFFVQRQIRGKWACKCCQLLLQEPAAAQVFDNGLPTPGLQAHTVISRFVDHLPYYRQEQINARSGVHTPRATLAGWAGHTGAQLMPLFEAHKDFVLGSRVLHGDETTVGLLDPGAGKTKTAYMWAYARGVFDPYPGVVYDFCTGRGGQFPFQFLDGWTGTLVRDGYVGYEKALLLNDRFDAGCMAHYLGHGFIPSDWPCGERTLRRLRPAELDIILGTSTVVGERIGCRRADPTAYRVECRDLRRQPRVAPRTPRTMPVASAGRVFVRPPWAPTRAQCPRQHASRVGIALKAIGPSAYCPTSWLRGCQGCCLRSRRP